MTTKLNTCLTISIQKTKDYMARTCISSLSIGGRKCKRERERERGGGGEKEQLRSAAYILSSPVSVPIASS